MIQSRFFALPEDVEDYTGKKQKEKQIAYLIEKGLRFHINSNNELKLPRVELERALAIQSQPSPKVATDWIEQDASKISRDAS